MSEKDFIHRKSRLSRERLAKLEEILSEENNVENQPSPDVYLRSDKDKELDMLWQGEKKSKSNSMVSNGIYLLIGFIIGVSSSFLMVFLFSFSAPKYQKTIEFTSYKEPSLMLENEEAEIQQDDSVAVVPISKIKNKKVPKPATFTETYIVKRNDSLDKISMIYYGVYNPEKIKEIQKLNNLSSPNKIRVGQKLIIPVQR